MGNSLNGDYASAFAEVATKTKWRKCLIIDINGKEQLYVADIRSINAGPPAGTLRVGENLSGTFYIYYYAGSSICIDPFDYAPLYEIYITTIPDSKIGGGRKTPPRADLIEFEAPQSKTECNPVIVEMDVPNLGFEPKNIFRSADGRAPTQPSISYQGDHPDDNIADE